MKKTNKNTRTEQLLKDSKAGGRRAPMPRPSVMRSKKDYHRNKKVDLLKLDTF